MSSIRRPLARLGLGTVVLAATALAANGPFTLLTVAISCGVGAFLIDRRPRNSVGWLVLAIGLSYLGTNTLPNLDIPGLVAGRAPWFDFLAVWIGAWAGGMTFIWYAAVAFVFPSGSLIQRRRRLIRVALVVGALAAIIPPALLPSIPITGPDGAELRIPNLLSPLGPDATATPPALGAVVSTMLPILLLAAGVVDLLRRYRLAVGTERLQMRWMLTAVAFLVVSVCFGLTLFTVVGPQLGIVAWIPTLLASPTIALAIGMAILRYRLYDIDRIISRTLGWAIVTGTVLVVFAGLVVALQTALAQIVETGTIAVAASTLIAAALFQPIRRRVQGAVDRRFDRARYDGQRTAAAFADRLRYDIDLDGLAQDFTATVSDAVRPTSASLWLLRQSGPSENRS